MFIVDHDVDLDVPGHTTKLRAPYSALLQILGAHAKTAPEKCSTIWGLRNEENTEHVLLRDRRDEDDKSFKPSTFRAQPLYDWDVWATDKKVATKFCKWLSAAVIAKIGEVKTLTAESKAELNKLVASGIPLGEAMKRVTLRTPTDLADRFGWPIKT
jgi:hypothetical protein